MMKNIEIKVKERILKNLEYGYGVKIPVFDEKQINTFLDLATGEVVAHFRLFIAGEGHTKPYTFTYYKFATWWDHLKWSLNKLFRRNLFDYNEVLVREKQNVYFTILYPDYKIPMDQKYGIIYETELGDSYAK